MTPNRPAAPLACWAPLTPGLKLSPMWVHIYSIFLGYQLNGGSYFGTPAPMQHTAHEVANAIAKRMLLVHLLCTGEQTARLTVNSIVMCKAKAAAQLHRFKLTI